MQTKQKRQLINIAVVLILLGLTVFILVKSNEELNYENVISFFKSCDPRWMLLAFLSMFAFLLFEAWSVKMILRTLGQKTKFHRAVAYSCADAYYSALTPSATGGQPASAFYMVKDGINAGTTSFALLFNLMAYTGAIFVLGISALVIAPLEFLQFNTFSKILVIFGGVTQVGLFLFFLACLRKHKAVLAFGNKIITLLCKIKLVKKEMKWRVRLADAVEKYRASGEAIREHRFLFFKALVLNVLQRGSQILITCFVCKSAVPESDILTTFAMQSFVLVGYNSIPLPGGTGAFEYLYMDGFAGVIPDNYLAVAVMVTRLISYYLCMIFSGIYTLVYHTLLCGKGVNAEKSVPQGTEVGQPQESEEPQREIQNGEKEQKEKEENGENGQSTIKSGN